MLIAGLLIFGAGSALAMTASSAGELIALRAVIGCGAALVMPATLSTITGTFPPAQRVKAVSVWAAVSGAAAILGVACSGVLLQAFSWESVFGLNVVLAALALVGVVRIVPESADKDAPRLDLGGAALAVVGLVALVYSIIEAPTVGWLAARTLIGFGISLIVFFGFLVYELRRQSPMLDPRVFTRRGLSAGSISVFVQFFAYFGFIFLVLQYLQIVRGHSALTSALYMLPIAITMMPTARLAPKLTAKFGARAVCASGLLLMAVGFSILAQLSTTSSDWLLTGGLLLLGAGMGAAMTPATSAITSALPGREQGVASAINDLSREVGGAVGIAVIGSIMTAVYRANLSLPGLPHNLLDQVRDSVAVAAHIGGPVAQHANTAFVDGIHVALFVAAAAVLVAAVAVTFLAPGRDARPSQDSLETADHAS